MNKEEFTKIVNRFNTDKHNYNWIFLLKSKISYRWERFKQKITNYPTYYNFISAAEFLFWLKHSEEENFIDNRFCPICGKFIEIIYTSSHFYNKACCKDHSKQLRQINTIKTNIKKYSVEYPLQNSEIHNKTIESGLKKNSYKEGNKKSIRTKIQKYGKANNGQKISETKKNWSKEQKEEWLKKVRETKENLYGDPDYNNINQIKQTCLKKYGVTNPSYSEKIKTKIAKNALQTRINNHSTVKELMESPEKRFNNLTYKENYSVRVQETKNKNHTNQRDLFISPIKNKDGLTYKENFVKKTQATKLKNNTFGSSHSLEEARIKFLKETYPQYTILRQYNEDSRYPFACDCYIKELDLFIEFQGSYFHNWRPFVESEETIKEYDEMIAKGGQKETIAETWKRRDPLKREVARKNGLNFYEYWERGLTEEEDSIYDPIERWKRFGNSY